MTTDVKFYAPDVADFLRQSEVKPRKRGDRAVMPNRADIVAVIAHSFGLPPARAEYACLLAFDGGEK